MHVKFVILDGFKSYGNRVSVGEFDPHFNAITGLNGSGKSNILDGIVFVLGLSSLNTVRAQNLSDLIFKGGNVKRASVSVVFDNSDKAKSPLGYEKYNEIVVSRTVEESSMCKYYLNSLVSTKKSIQDMFESVQLNINNPNFMIMQGKITKVVNMKPKEILHMIEECVGATTYQTKRDKALSDIGEKGKQIDEIEDTLDTVIMPALRRQELAYQLYQEFKTIERTRHRIGQLYAIAAYGHYTEVVQQKEEEVSGLKQVDTNEYIQLVQYKQQIGDMQKRREEIKKESHKIQTEKVSGIEKQLKEERKKVATQEVAVDTAAMAVKEFEHKFKKAQKALQNEEKQVAEFRKKSGSLIDEFTAIKAEIEEAETSLATCKERESELNAGKVLGEDGKTFDLRERLVVVEEEIGKIRPLYDHEGRVLKAEEKQLGEAEAKLAKTQTDEQIERNFKSAEQETNNLQRQLQQLNITPEEYLVADNEYNLASQKISKLDAQRRECLREYPNMEFSYTDPYPNFNRKSVHGSFYELFETPDLGKYRDAFEVAAGGSLGIIVVDTPEISKAIIRNGNVARRRTYMPLSALYRKDRLPSQVEIDRRVGGSGKAVPALNFVKYEKKYENLMQHYLGSAILCDTMDTAKIVAFQMKYKAVTLQGDVCDPDGMMQGGARKNLGLFITTCQKLRTVNIELAALNQTVHQLKGRIEVYRQNSGLLKRFDQATRNLNNIIEERQCTAYASLLAEVTNVKSSIKEKKTKMDAWSKEMAVWTKEEASLRKTLDSFEEVKSRNLKSAKAEIIKWTKALEMAKKKYDSKKATFESVEMDLKAKETLLDDFKKDIDKAEKELKDAKETEIQTKKLLEEVNVIFDEKRREHDEAAEEYRVWDGESAKLESEVQALQKKIQKLEIGKMKRDNTLKNLEEQVQVTKSTLDALQKKHPELKLRTNYDQLEKPTKSLKKCKEDMDTAEKKYDDMRQRVDPEAAERLEETKELKQSALSKLEQLKENKEDIFNAISVLDKQKATLVEGAYLAVNDEFGKMMSTLLPESTAKLVPVTSEEKLEDGVNIHVRLGDVWKESLTELSGGQRSLVALALVLSLCMYQPAPFYVLDEIDAALDLSHTQNIGVLIKQRFKDTQFICVSLKDGMYTNANVLFTTQFQDGRSNVIRTSKHGTGTSGNVEKYANEGKKRQKGVRLLKRNL